MVTRIVQPEREVIINCFVLGKDHILHISYRNHNIPHSVVLATKAFAATACSFVKCLQTSIYSAGYWSVFGNEI